VSSPGFAILFPGLKSATETTSANHTAESHFARTWPAQARSNSESQSQAVSSSDALMSRPLLAILIAAVLLRLFFSFGVNRTFLGITPENEITDGYHEIAENLYAGHGYRQFLSHPPTVQRPPGYVFFLRSLFEVAGTNYALVQIVQALLGALGCWLLFLLGRWVLSERLGLVAAALYAIYPNSIQYSARLYSENLYFPLFLALAYFLCRAAIEGSRLRGFLAGLFWGLSILTRGTLVALPLAIPFGIALSRRHRSPIRRWTAWMIPALAGALLVVTPWTMRNYDLTGSFVPVSSWGWAPFYHGVQCSKAMLKWADLRKIDIDACAERERIIFEKLYDGDRTKAFTSASEFVRHEKAAKELVLDELKADPLGAMGRSLVGLVFTWFQTLGQKMRVLSLAVHLPLLILFLLGVRRMSKEHPEAFSRAWPALGMILFVNLFQAVIFPHIRYMSPAIALSFVFSALPLIELRRRTEREVSS